MGSCGPEPDLPPPLAPTIGWVNEQPSTNPPNERLTLGAAFAPADHEAWRAAAEKALRGKPVESLITETIDGVSIDPLYTEGPGVAAGVPGAAPFVRGATPTGGVLGGWDVRQHFAQTDPAAQNAAILDGLERGVTSVWVRTDEPGDLERILEGVLLDLAPVALDAGHATEHVARALVSLWQDGDHDPATIRGSFRADPLGRLARTGGLRSDLAHSYEHLVGLVTMSASLFPQVRSVAVDATVYADAGATEVQELAYSIATGVAYLRALVDGGLAIDQAAREIEFTYAASADQFATIAKLRAARRLWARVGEASGIAAGAAQRQHAVTSRSMLTRHDPWVNLLRTTIACFAAGVGGAESVTTRAFDAAIGAADEIALRLARNTQLLLIEESNLARVIDPAGGSWYVESLTDDYAQAAWSLFQSIEAAGGFAQHLTGGAVAEDVGASVAARRAAVATRRQPITGVSEFADLDEEALDRPAAPAPRGVPADAKLTIEPIAPYRPSSAFEELRDAAAGHDSATIFLANLGPLAAHTARTSWSVNFFAAGGIRAVDAGSFSSPEDAEKAYRASGCRAAVLCSSDELYLQHAVATAKALKRADATLVLLAGNPGERKVAYAGAGIDGFVHVGSDAVAVLQSLHRLLGLTPDEPEPAGAAASATPAAEEASR